MKNDGNDDDSSAPSQPHWRRYYAWKSEIRWKKIQPKPPWAHIFVKTKTNSAHPLSLKRDKESETKNTEIHQHNIDKKPFLGYDKRIWNYEQFCYTTHIPSDIKQRILKEIEREPVRPLLSCFCHIFEQKTTCTTTANQIHTRKNTQLPRRKETKLRHFDEVKRNVVLFWKFPPTKQHLKQHREHPWRKIEK